MSWEKDGVTSFYDPREKVLVTGSETRWCDACHLIHHVELPCAIVMARVHALIVEPGDELRDDELEGIDRPAFISALRLRGISVDVYGDGVMRAIATLGDTGGVPVHVDDDDTAPLSGNGR